ncbi:MAG: DUF6607 family protein, partial [Alphaproteobacteria bacterium]|nr:DUF6607 family protein [Alphaproteobacteria bacterium]
MQSPVPLTRNALLRLGLAAMLCLSILHLNEAAAAEQEGKSLTKFEQDRQAILAMAGNFQVTFDFEETVPLAKGYALKDPKISKGHEIVRVIEDRGDRISLQHILVVGDEKKI